VITNLVSTNGHPDGFQFIGRDITNEVRMQENQQFYLQQITKAHEEERLRISRDLHDSTAQDLIAGLHQLEEFCEGQPGMPKEELNFLWALHGQLKNTLHDIRQLSRDLRPSIIDDLGILPALEWLTEQLTTENNIETNLDVRGNEHRLAPEIEVTLFRIVQEALRNVVKHADATETRVSIEFGDDETKIAIADNGKGFNMPTSLGEFSRLGKLGLDGMQTRARLAGGTFDVISDPGKGTTIAVTVPS
jgi:signal transduction histidine kinase